MSIKNEFVCVEFKIRETDMLATHMVSPICYLVIADIFMDIIVIVEGEDGCVLGHEIMQ